MDNIFSLTRRLIPYFYTYYPRNERFSTVCSFILPVHWVAYSTVISLWYRETFSLSTTERPTVYFRGTDIGQTEVEENNK